MKSHALSQVAHLCISTHRYQSKLSIRNAITFLAVQRKNATCQSNFDRYLSRSVLIVHHQLQQQPARTMDELRYLCEKEVHHKNGQPLVKNQERDEHIVAQRDMSRAEKHEHCCVRGKHNHHQDQEQSAIHAVECGEVVHCGDKVALKHLQRLAIETLLTDAEQ